MITIFFMCLTFFVGVFLILAAILDWEPVWWCFDLGWMSAYGGDQAGRYYCLCAGKLLILIALLFGSAPSS
jgi:hypothetical protein